MARPPKIGRLEALVQAAATAGNYRLTIHAEERMKQRAIDDTEVEYVLENGHHRKSKDKWDDTNKSWKYAYCGRTLDGRNLRLAIAMHKKIIVITVIDEDKEDDSET